jgi:hypothetical protein
MADSFTLEIAGFPVRVEGDDAEVMYSLRQRYRSFLCERKPIHVVEVHSRKVNLPPKLFDVPVQFPHNGLTFEHKQYQGQIDLRASEAILSVESFSLADDIEYFLRMVYSLLIFERGGMLFHSAAIVRENQAYLFFGLSGSGKTTAARLSADYLVLNDDLVALVDCDTHWQVFGTPFWNPSQVKPSARSAPLHMLLRLVQDHQVYVEPLSAAQGMAEMITSIPLINADPSRTHELVQRCRAVMNSVPIFRLHFRKDNTFWKVIAEANGMY